MFDGHEGGAGKFARAFGIPCNSLRVYSILR